MIRFLSFSWVLVSFFVFIGCKNKPDTRSDASFDKIDSLRATFLNIEDSLVHAWNVMINDDNKKIKNLKRLVEEVEYGGGVDTFFTASLIEKILKMKEKRFTCKSMSDSDLIDHYDSISQLIISQVDSLATNHKEYERYALMHELIEEINEAQGRILFYRLDYDDVAKEYNEFIINNQDVMAQIDEDNKSEKLPVFELASE